VVVVVVVVMVVVVVVVVSQAVRQGQLRYIKQVEQHQHNSKHMHTMAGSSAPE
jgi:predicted PurR-regulated permease PerM